MLTGMALLLGTVWILFYPKNSWAWLFNVQTPTAVAEARPTVSVFIFCLLVNLPIIVIQADHGSALYVDLNDLPGSCMKERFSNFTAYYLPGASPDVIPQDISVVNIFRIVLDEYFNAHLGILENHLCFMDGFYLFDNQDVTDRVDDSCVIRE